MNWSHVVMLAVFAVALSVVALIGGTVSSPLPAEQKSHLCEETARQTAILERVAVVVERWAADDLAEKQATTFP